MQLEDNQQQELQKKTQQESEIVIDESKERKTVGLTDTLKQVSKVSRMAVKNKELCC